LAGDEVELRVRPAASISGLVLRPDDLPAIGAEVVLRPSSRGGSLARRSALTDSGGGYRFDGVDAGEYLLSVTSSEGGTPQRSGVAVQPGDAQRVDLRLERGIELRGRVTDAVTGAPIAGAEICESWIFAKRVLTDADGGFVYPDFPHEGYQEITVRARGYGRRGIDVLGPFESVPSKSFLEVELRPAATVSGRVVAADGRPLLGVYVACAASVFTDDGQQTDWRAGRTDEAGRYRIDDVRTDVTHALFLQRDGLGTVAYEIGVPRREHEVPDIVMRPGVPVSGRVLDPGGAPVAGAEVELWGCNADRSSRFGQPAESCLDSYIAERELRTDTKGRFAFTDVADGEYAVVARLAGTRGGDRHPFTVAGEPVDAGVLELAAGLSIAGRVVGPEGEGASGVFVNAWREDGLGAGTGVSVLTGLDGGFELAGLEPGDYRLQLVPYEAHEGRFFAGALRGAVPAGTRGMLVALADAADLRGRVVDAAGAPVAGVSVEMIVPSEPGAWEQTNSEGRFVFHPPRGVEVELVAHPPQAHPDTDLPFQYDPDPARETRLAGVDADKGEVLLVLPDAR
jgi:protocatechuate 3,4-dioxygenase beta subunit